MGVPMIDLDARPIRAEAEAGARGPGPLVPRSVLVMALLALIMAGLSGAAPPPPGLREVLVAGGTAAAAFELGADAIYTAHYGQNNPNNESAVRRWDLSTGREKWATALPQGVQNLVVDDGAGVLMARNDWGISFLDSATGKVLWTSTAVNTSAVTLGSAGVLFTADFPGRTLVRVADPRTGNTRWLEPVDARVYFGTDPPHGGIPARAVAVGGDGTVVVLDFASGRELSRGSLGGPLRPAYEPTTDGVLMSTVRDNRLVLRRRAAGRTTMEAYSLIPFAKLWERTRAPMGLASDCGVTWCVSSPAGPGGPAELGVSGVDPGTGEARWHVSDLAFADPYGDGLLLGGDMRETPGLSLLDPANGQVLRRFGQSVPVGDHLLLHQDAGLPGQTWVQSVDARGRLIVQGRVDVGAPFGCVAEGAYLACPTPPGPTKVWQIPAG